jgi:hypothetical protein
MRQQIVMPLDSLACFLGAVALPLWLAAEEVLLRLTSP